jgi:hypothetical protein
MAGGAEMKRLALGIAVLSGLLAVATASEPSTRQFVWAQRIGVQCPAVLEPSRGDTMVIAPSFSTNLSAAWYTYILYTPSGATNAYRIDGVIEDAAAGRVAYRWNASNEFTQASYKWEAYLCGPTSSVVATWGDIKFRNTIGRGATVTPLNQPINILDFATVQILNVGSAPWISSYEISDIRTFIAGVQNGAGDLDVDDLNVRGALTYPVVDWALTNIAVSGFGTLTRTGPHTATLLISGDGGGGGGGIGSYTNTQVNGVDHTYGIRIADSQTVTWSLGSNGVWTAVAGIPGTWSSSTGLYLVVGGQVIGRFDTNGITLFMGTLSLWENDLKANVRLGDGTRNMPSLTLDGHPNTIGIYGRGYAGSYGFGFAHASNDVGIIYEGGILLLSTNAAFRGRVVGDLSTATNYPEPLFTNWYSTLRVPSMTLTNSGAFEMRDAGGTVRFRVDGSTGVAISDGKTMAVINTNWPSGPVTNGFGGRTNVDWWSYGVVTNRTWLN